MLSAQIETRLKDLDAQRSVITEAIIVFRESVQRQQGALSAKQEQLDGITKTREALLATTERKLKAQEVLKLILERVSEVNRAKMVDMVNHALKLTFTDIDIVFDIQVDDRRGTKEYTPVLQNGNGIVGDTDSFGGGVWVLVDFVLKVLIHMFSNRYPVMAMDESLAAVSSEYVGPASQLIKELAQEYSIKFLVITHQAALASSATAEYKTKLIDGVSNYTRIEKKAEAD